MRKVKLAAIQPRYIPLPGKFNPYSKHYQNDPDRIIEEYIKPQIEVTLKLLKEAGESGCDIVTTGEDLAGVAPYYMDISEKNILGDLVEKSQVLVEKELSDLARQYSMYIIGCYAKKSDGRLYNTASIFDRSGQIIGDYKKTHLPPDEKWQLTEGSSIDVFRLDFGTVGICICYDMMFPEVVRVLSLKGAEVIFHPTAGYGWYDAIGEATLRTRANDNSVYIVTAKNYVFNHAGRSSVIDHWGHIMVDAGFRENVVVMKEVDLDEKKLQPSWYNPTQVSGIPEVNIRHRKERRPELYTEITKPNEDPFVGLTEKEKFEVLKRIISGECHW